MKALPVVFVDWAITVGFGGGEKLWLLLPPLPSPSKMKLPIEWFSITVHEEEEVM